MNNERLDITAWMTDEDEAQQEAEEITKTEQEIDYNLTT